MSITFAYDGLTNTTTQRDSTQEELDNLALIEAAQAEKTAHDEATAAATAAAIEHAKSLGFTDAMIAVMYPSLGA